MRELKFRAWNERDKTMHELGELKLSSNDGDYGYTSFSIGAQCGQFTGGNYGMKTYRDWPLMQYTGLSDKNGKEIYESDILGHPNSDEKGVIVWDKVSTSFRVQYNNDPDYKLALFLQINSKGQATVIGNVHDNPELLEDRG